MLAASLLAASFTGCAFNKQEANLNPTAAVFGSDVGRGREVAVRVTDERPTRELGRRGTAYGPAAAITSEQDLAEVIHGEVVRGLQRHGFTVVPYGADRERVLNVELRHLEYSTSQGFWTGGVHVNGAMKAIGDAGGQRYEQFYRSDHERRAMVVPTADKNERILNEGLGELIGDMLNDEELMRFLAR